MIEILGLAASVAVPVVGFIVWLVRLEGRQNVSDARHQALERRLDATEQTLIQRLVQIEEKLDRVIERLLGR